MNGADGGRLFVRCFDGFSTVRENVASDVLASLTTMVWNAPSKSWTGGATMADASLNCRMTVRLGDAIAFAQIGIVGLDGPPEPHVGGRPDRPRFVGARTIRARSAEKSLGHGGSNLADTGLASDLPERAGPVALLHLNPAGAGDGAEVGPFCA